MASVERSGWRGSVENIINAGQIIDSAAILLGTVVGNINLVLAGVAGLTAGIVGKDALKQKHV